MKKILLICNTSNSVVLFRKNLVAALQKRGHEVAVIAFDERKRAEIESWGVKFFVVEDKNRSKNPFKLFGLKNKYKRIIQELSPDIVFTFMLKPNIFGTRAALSAGVKSIYSMVEGAGDVFINGGFKRKLIRRVVCGMYRKSFKIPDKVFFLNSDDIKEFVERKLVSAEKCETVYGIGVDVERFTPSPLENTRRFLMIARMLKTKGVIEYCKAARIVKQKYPDAKFDYLGGEGDVKVDDIREYIDDGSVDYLGTTADVRPYINACSALVLPTYREGFPVCVMEAMASGRAVIASDTNGCRDAVENGVSGFLTPLYDVDALAEKIIWCIENPEKTAELGANGRRIAEEKFDQRLINNELCEFILKNEGDADNG